MFGQLAVDETNQLLFNRMGCNSSKQPETPPTEEEEPEVESVPERPKTLITKQKPPNKLLIEHIDPNKLIFAAKLSPLLSPETQQQFQDHEHHYLSVQYALHAHNATYNATIEPTDRPKDQDENDENDPSDHNRAAPVDADAELDASKSTLSVVGLSKALNLPHAHINPEPLSTDTLHKEDCYARQLYRCFAKGNNKIDYQQFVHTIGTMTNKGTADTDAFHQMMYDMFNINQNEQGITYQDMLDMTMSVFQMACHDGDFETSMNAVGLDWVSCSVTYESTLQMLCNEWLSDTFAIGGNGGNDSYVTKEQFNQWLTNVFDLTRSTATATTVVEEQHDDSTTNPVEDQIDWGEGSTDDEEDVSIHQSSGGTGYI
jgi:hypothetical protein